ncbi:MAG: hypothetical protein HZB59_05470 [Ignavibacteriales bacterium]|nr:hypothetical protein [Ignavibacteriales bacterium]
MIIRIRDIIKKTGLVVCLLILLASCNPDHVNVDPGPLESYTFANNQIQIWADRRHVMIDSSFHIMQQCRPLYSGKGVIELQLLGGGRTVFIDSPLSDTLPNTDQHSTVPVLFIANNDFMQSWTVRLHSPGNTSYGFEGYVRMDSILIGAGYYSIDSEEAKSIAPIGHRFRAWAYTHDMLIIETP